MVSTSLQHGLIAETTMHTRSGSPASPQTVIRALLVILFLVTATPAVVPPPVTQAAAPTRQAVQVGSLTPNPAPAMGALSAGAPRRRPEQ
jgi:hypothetical protein